MPSDRVDQNVAHRVRRYVKAWGPGLELVAILHMHYWPHGGDDDVEVIVKTDAAKATRVRRPRRGSPIRCEVALTDEQVARLCETIEAVSAWDLRDQSAPVRDGRMARVGLADGQRSNAFSAHMPRGPHKQLVYELLALVPLEE